MIWTCYRASVAEIVAALSRHRPLVIDGSVAQSQARAAVVEKFQTDPRSLVLVANLSAAGAGITSTPRTTRSTTPTRTRPRTTSSPSTASIGADSPQRSSTTT